MTKDELISDISNNPDYLKICKNIAGDSSIHKDLYQEMVLVILEYTPSKIEQLKCPRCFVIKILSNMWNSTTSQFFFKYRREHQPNIKPTDELEEEQDIKDEGYIESWIDEAYSSAKSELDKLYWYDRELFKIFLEKGTYRRVQDDVGIDKMSVFYTVKKVKEKLKQKIEKDSISNGG